MKQDIDHALIDMVRQASPASREALRQVLARRKAAKQPRQEKTDDSE